MKNKIAIIVGHRSKLQGAYSEYLRQTEYEFNKKVASYLTDIADIHYRPDTPFTSEKYKRLQVLKAINQKRYDLVIELHFNAFHEPKAHGCTALHYITNKRTKKLARRYVYLMNKAFKVRKRELISISSKTQRGGQMIIDSYADFVLLEPFFGSNIEALKFKGMECEYSEVIRELINYSYEN